MLNQENEERRQKLKSYLNSLCLEAKTSKNAGFTEKTIDIAWEVWERLRNHFLTKSLSLEVPNACPGENDNILYVWIRSEHYCECEILSNGQIEFFYRNAHSNQIWAEDISLSEVGKLPPIGNKPISYLTYLNIFASTRT